MRLDKGRRKVSSSGLFAAEGWRRRTVPGKWGHFCFACYLEVGSGGVGLTEGQGLSGGEGNLAVESEMSVASRSGVSVERK